MSHEFCLADAHSLGDLHVYLSRAARVEDGSVRLIAAGPVLAVYAAVLYPVGLLDQSPTVLGLRTFALTTPAAFDAVVPARGLLERVARLQNAELPTDAPVTVSVPPPVTAASWAAISPPRGGWTHGDPAPASVLDSVARAGIDEVAAAIPTGTGEQIVHKVRSEVWGRPIPGIERVPAGAAFAAMSLGFLGEDDAAVYETGAWVRLSTKRGHVLVKRRVGLGAGLGG